MRRLILISLALFVVACFFRADCVHAEDLRYDIITFADADELGRKQKWIIGYVDTVHNVISRPYQSEEIVTVEDFGYRGSATVFDSITIIEKLASVDYEIPPVVGDTTYLYSLWSTYLTYHHRQFVDKVITKLPSYMIDPEPLIEDGVIKDIAKYNLVKGEALITWREVTK